MNVNTSYPEDNRNQLQHIAGGLIEGSLVFKDVAEEINAEERFECIFASNPAPSLMLRLSDNTYIKVNHGFLQMTGYERDELIGKRFHDLDVLQGAEQRDDALAALHQQRTIEQQEARLCVNDGTSRSVIVAGQPIEVAGEACMLFTFIDMERRKAVSKRSETELVAAIDAVMKDGSWFSHTVMEKLAQLRSTNASGLKVELSALTPRETEILTLICIGKSNAEIVVDLNLSCNTVRNHIANLYDKIGVGRRSAAVVWGRERGLVGY